MNSQDSRRGPRVKVCGLTRESDARAAVDAGATFLGAIRASGPRLITIERVAEVLGPRRAGVQRAAVFAEQSLDAIRRDADHADLDIAQLHATPQGSTLHDAIATVASDGRIAWPVLRVGGTALPADAHELAAHAGHLVLDAHVAGQLGGTGVALDWQGLQDAIAALRAAVPDVTLILAGGLRPENVAHAIQLLRPDVVDVSSGVESAPGVKDPARMQQFVAAVRSAAEPQ